MTRTSGPSSRAAAVSASTVSRLGQLRANRMTPPSPDCSASAARSSGIAVPSNPTASAWPGPVAILRSYGTGHLLENSRRTGYAHDASAREERPRAQGEHLRPRHPAAAGKLHARRPRRPSRLRSRSARERLQRGRGRRGAHRSRVSVLRLRDQETDALCPGKPRPNIQRGGHVAEPRGEGAGVSDGSRELQRLRRGVAGVLSGTATADDDRHDRAPRPRHPRRDRPDRHRADRKSTRLNSSHGSISYAVFCLKKKKKTQFMILLRYKKERR